MVGEKVVDTPAPSFKNIKAETKESRVTLNFFVDNIASDVEKFKIVYGESPEKLTREVLTYATGKILQKDGSFQWYIDKLEPKSYTFKILGVKSDGTLLAGLESENVTATLGSASCSVGNV